MLESLDLYQSVANKPVQPQQEQSIAGRESVQYSKFEIATFDNHP
jgi:hypothetical protein